VTLELTNKGTASIKFWELGKYGALRVRSPFDATNSLFLDESVHWVVLPKESFPIVVLVPESATSLQCKIPVRIASKEAVARRKIFDTELGDRFYRIIRHLTWILPSKSGTEAAFESEEFTLESDDERGREH
jgi:hypothetical protein